MQKRGQFTLFVVLGIVLVLAVGLFYIFREDIFGVVGLSSELSYPSEVSEVVDHVQECVDDSVNDAVLTLGYAGGYSEVPEQSYVDASYGYVVPYYLYDGEDVSLSLEELQEELNQETSSLLEVCIDVEQFSDFSISTGDVKVESSIEQNLVSVTVDYPMTVSVAESRYSLTESYYSDVEVNLGWLHSIAQQIVLADLENPDTIDYQELLSYGVAHITVAPVTNDTYVYILEDTTSFNGEKNYSFFFAEYYAHAAALDAECFLDLDCAEEEFCVDGQCVGEEA